MDDGNLTGEEGVLLNTIDAHFPDDMDQRLNKLFRYSQVGRCVSSVTHDLNNYLGAIQAYSELIDLDEGLSDESRRMVSKLGEGVSSCSRLLGTLTSVARKERDHADMVDLVQLVRNTVDLKKYDFATAHVALETSFEEGLPSMVLDPPKVTMALVHLIMNALEATEGETKPRVAVRVRKLDDGAAVEVWNSGAPIDPDLIERLFEPFFTTKEGEHLGLGLAVVRHTARMHDGDLTYDKSQGFVMRLPFRNNLQP